MIGEEKGYKMSKQNTGTANKTEAIKSKNYKQS
jgi:hypothetical protein